MQIIVNGATAQIVECTASEERELVRMFTVPVATESPFKENPDTLQPIKLYEKGSKFLPSGLIPMLQKFWVHQIEIKDVPDAPVQRVPIQFGGYTLRNDQILAANKALHEKRGILAVDTGGGKTIIMGALLSVLPKPAAVMIHTIDILEQLVYEFQAGGLDVGTITTKGIDINHDIVVCMNKLLGLRIPTTAELNIWWRTKIRTLMVDEAHHTQSNTYQNILCSCGADYRFGFTGTTQPPRTQKYWKTVQYLGPVLCTITSGQLADIGAIVPVRVRMIDYKHNAAMVKALWEKAKTVAEANWEAKKIALGEELRANKNDYDFMRKNAWKYSQLEKPLFTAKGFSSQMAKVFTTGIYRRLILQYLVITNPERNQLIADEAKEGTGVLVVVDESQHGIILQQMIPGSYFIQGKSKDRKQRLEELKQKQIRCLIATSLVDEGINIHGINKIVLASGGKAPIKLAQRIGRGVRKDTNKEYLLVVDINDKRQPMLERHAKERMYIYKQKGFRFLEELI